MGSNARRRRGLGPNGIPIEPTATKPKSKAATAKARSAGPSTSNPKKNAVAKESTVIAPQRATPVATIAPIPDIAPVHHMARVQIIQQVTTTDASGIIVTKQHLVATVMATKLCSASARFDGFVRAIPNFKTRNVFNFIIPEEDTTSSAILEFARWLNTISAPFPRTYLGVKHLPTRNASNVDYDIIQIAALYKLANWLDLKVPFSAGRLVSEMWAYFKDTSIDLYPEEVIAVWESTTDKDVKLRKHVIWNTVDYIDDVTAQQELDTFSTYFTDAFQNHPDTSLLEAFSARSLASAEFHNRKVQKKQRRQEAIERRRREAKEWRRMEKAQKKQDDQVKQKVRDFRGVGVISADDVQNLDLAALRGRP